MATQTRIEMERCPICGQSTLAVTLLDLTAADGNKAIDGYRQSEQCLTPSCPGPGLRPFA